MKGVPYPLEVNGGYYAASPDPSFLITGVPSPPEVIGGSNMLGLNMKASLLARFRTLPR